MGGLVETFHPFNQARCIVLQALDVAQDPQCAISSCAGRINEFLAQMLEQQTTQIFNGKSADVPDIQARIVLLDDEIADLEDKVRLLIRKQLAAGEDIQSRI